MKGSRWFIIFIAAFLLLMFAVEYHLPKKFVWTPTFSHFDSQPFGCALFDSLLSSSLTSGYSLSKESFYQLEQNDSATQRGILVIAKDLKLTSMDVEAVLKMVERGNKVMLVSTSFGHSLEDTLKFQCSYSFFNPMEFKKQATALLERDSICWVGDSTVYPRQMFRVYPQFCKSSFKDEGLLPIRQLAKKGVSEEYQIDHPLVAFVRPWGKGELILVSTPLLFTNYGILDGQNATYLFRILSQMGELPIVRSEAYMKETAQEQQSLFRYLLSQRPLRWALYLTMISILLFMVFTARRRQRVVPVIREPANKSLEFIELIGTLYYQKKDHADLVRKKFTYFAEVMRREVQVDVEEVEGDERSFHRIAQKTGMDAEDVGRFIREVRPVVYGGYTISDDDMKRLIDKMNEIMNLI